MYCLKFLQGMFYYYIYIYIYIQMACHSN